MPRKYNYKFQKVKPVILFIWGYRCYLCQSFGFDLDVHHLNSDPTDNLSMNLIPLCKCCHKSVHKVIHLDQVIYPDDVLVQLKYLDLYWSDYSRT
jgi:hypothetical protein